MNHLEEFKAKIAAAFPDAVETEGIRRLRGAKGILGRLIEWKIGADKVAEIQILPTPIGDGYALWMGKRKDPEIYQFSEGEPNKEVSAENT